MGIIALTLKALAFSTCSATVRQFAGYNLKGYILPKITHPLANTAVTKFFDAGEYIVTTTRTLVFVNFKIGSIGKHDTADQNVDLNEKKNKD